MSIIEERRANRNRFLQLVYEKTDGSCLKGVRAFDVGDELGLNRKDVDDFAFYWCQKGYINRTLDRVIRMTTDGITFVEERLSAAGTGQDVKPEVPKMDAGARDTDIDDRSISHTPSGGILDDQGWYTHSQLANVFGVGSNALRKRLDRFREKSLDGWTENEDRRPREPKHLYRLKDVRSIIEELQATRERPAK